MDASRTTVHKVPKRLLRCLKALLMQTTAETGWTLQTYNLMVCTQNGATPNHPYLQRIHSISLSVYCFFESSWNFIIQSIHPQSWNEMTAFVWPQNDLVRPSSMCWGGGLQWRAEAKAAASARAPAALWVCATGTMGGMKGYKKRLMPWWIWRMILSKQITFNSGSFVQIYFLMKPSSEILLVVDQDEVWFFVFAGKVRHLLAFCTARYKKLRIGPSMSRPKSSAMVLFYEILWQHPGVYASDFHILSQGDGAWW